jgi:NDP-sugar pyrophosphorylase family protein
VMNSDILSTMDISKMLAGHEESGASVTVAAKLHEMNVPFGVLDVNGSNVTAITEKPNAEFLVNAGAYLIRSSYLKHVKPGEIIDMTTLINRGIKNNEQVVPFVLLNNWLDIGRLEQLEMARRDFR